MTLTVILIAVALLILAWRLTGHKRPSTRETIRQTRAEGEVYRAEMARLRAKAAERKAARHRPPGDGDVPG